MSPPPRTSSRLPRRAPRASAAAAGLALAALACGGGEGPTPPGRRVLVVGWDGASWEAIDPLLAAGRLPNLQRVIDAGFAGDLRSTLIPISSAAWTAATTGELPGRSGVYSFFERLPDSYDVALIDARTSEATPIWRTLTRRGKASVVFGVPVTYPPEPIRGTLVAGMLAPEDAAYTWPPGYADELRRRGFVPDVGMWRRDAPLTDPEVIRRQLDLKRAALTELLARDDWSLAWVVYKSLDVLSHVAYTPATDGPIAGHLEALDRELGALLDVVGERCDVVVASDHGFTRHRFHFDPLAWLVAEGFAAPAAERGAGADRSGLALDEAVLLRERELLARLDLAASRVLPGPCEGRYGSLRLNLAGREPEGVVPPEDRDGLIARVIERLRAARTPAREPLVVRALPTAELYPGPYADRLPDVVFELLPDHLARPSRAAPRAVLSRLPAPIPDHDRTGVLAGAGPHLRRLDERVEAGVEDLAPTALALLGEPLYADLDGAPLLELLRDVPPPETRPESEDPPDHPGLEEFLDADLSEEELEEVQRRLEGLGYTR